MKAKKNGTLEKSAPVSLKLQHKGTHFWQIKQVISSILTMILWQSMIILDSKGGTLWEQ